MEVDKKDMLKSIMEVLKIKTKTLYSKILKPKRPKLMIGVVCLIVLIVFAACFSLVHEKAAASKQEAAEEEKIQTKKNDIVVEGSVGYTDSYQINIDLPCTVDKVIVKEGQSVKKGDELVTLNMDEYENNIKKLENQLSSDKTKLSDVTQSTSGLEADIAQLRSDIAKKTYEYESGTRPELQVLQNSLMRIDKEISDAKDDYEKQKTLFAAGATSKETLDNYEDIVDQKEKSKIQIEDNIQQTKNTLKDELDSLNTSLQYKLVQFSKMSADNSANTDMQNISINVDSINLDVMKNKTNKAYIKDNKIVCNIDDGVVQNISVINGSSLGAQNAPQKVLEIIDVGTIVVRAEVPEEFIMHVKKGSTAKIVHKSDKSKVIKGRVTMISNVATDKDGDKIVKVDIKPDDIKGFLKAGYTVDVTFDE